jgi:hypothetical protein
MDKIELIIKSIKESHKDLKIDKQIKDLEKQIQKARNTPDDEYSLQGDAEQGRKNKESVIENHTYTIGYLTSANFHMEEFLRMLSMTTEEILSSLEHDIEVKKNNKKTLDSLFKKIKTSKKEKTDNHIEWCELHGTGLPWAISEKCDCPGAYSLRKRMSEGMTFDEAKKWVIDNEMF